jgi:hypothetical protein
VRWFEQFAFEQPLSESKMKSSRIDRRGSLTGLVDEAHEACHARLAAFFPLLYQIPLTFRRVTRIL